jgi:hypothetical protein
VPRQSVFLDAGKTICFVSERGTLTQRRVEIGRDNNKFAHVISGLEEGEIVLLSPPSSWEPAPPPEEEAPGIPEGVPAPSADAVVASPAADAQPPTRPAGSVEGPPGGPGTGNFSAEQEKSMRERYEAMSPEERAERMKRYGGSGSGGGGDRGRGRGNRSDGEEE